MKLRIELIIILLSAFMLNGCENQSSYIDIRKLDAERILVSANTYLTEKPVTVTAHFCDRSLGNKHDFYSEGDYWWPDSLDPAGPYIRKDGHTNPDNFTAHRVAMRNMSVWVPTLVAAYDLTGDLNYAEKALEHLKAWFINEETMMNPNLMFGQAIKGRVSGRGIGIIDTIHLIEVAKAIERLKALGFLKPADFDSIAAWFKDYTTWLTTHQYGIDERDHGNNHSAWWVAQVAAFAHLNSDAKQMDFCCKFYKEVVLPNQMDTKGRFIDELTRTKPYSYSLFNLEAFALICQILSTEDDDLWHYETSDGKSVQVAFEFMCPFIANKANWPYPPDIEHFNELPVRGSALFFGGLAYQSSEYIDLWKTLEPDPTEQEIIRTFVIRQPVLWVD